MGFRSTFLALFFALTAEASVSPNQLESLDFFKAESQNLSSSLRERVLERSEKLLEIDEAKKALENNEFYPLYCEGVSVSILFVQSETADCVLLLKPSYLTAPERFEFEITHSGWGYDFTIIGGGLVKTVGAIVTPESPYEIYGGYKKYLFQTAGDEEKFQIRLPDYSFEPDHNEFVPNHESVKSLITTKILSTLSTGIFHGRAVLKPKKP